MAGDKSGHGASAIYGFGVFGAWFYFFSEAGNFWEVVLGFFQGLFWPAWMVFAAFDSLYA